MAEERYQEIATSEDVSEMRKAITMLTEAMVQSRSEARETREILSQLSEQVRSLREEPLRVEAPPRSQPQAHNMPVGSVPPPSPPDSPVGSGAHGSRTLFKSTVVDVGGRRSQFESLSVPIQDTVMGEANKLMVKSTQVKGAVQRLRECKLSEDFDYVSGLIFPMIQWIVTNAPSLKSGVLARYLKDARFVAAAFVGPREAVRVAGETMRVVYPIDPGDPEDGSVMFPTSDHDRTYAVAFDPALEAARRLGSYIQEVEALSADASKSDGVEVVELWRRESKAWDDLVREQGVLAFYKDEGQSHLSDLGAVLLAVAVVNRLAEEFLSAVFSQVKTAAWDLTANTVSAMLLDSTTGKHTRMGLSGHDAITLNMGITLRASALLRVVHRACPDSGERVFRAVRSSYLMDVSELIHFGAAELKNSMVAIVALVRQHAPRELLPDCTVLSTLMMHMYWTLRRGGPALGDRLAAFERAFPVQWKIIRGSSSVASGCGVSEREQSEFDLSKLASRLDGAEAQTALVARAAARPVDWQAGWIFQGAPLGVSKSAVLQTSSTSENSSSEGSSKSKKKKGGAQPSQSQEATSNVISTETASSDAKQGQKGSQQQSKKGQYGGSGQSGGQGKGYSRYNKGGNSNSSGNSNNGGNSGSSGNGGNSGNDNNKQQQSGEKRAESLRDYPRVLLNPMSVKPGLCVEYVKSKLHILKQLGITIEWVKVSGMPVDELPHVSAYSLSEIAHKDQFLEAALRACHEWFTQRCADPSSPSTSSNSSAVNAVDSGSDARLMELSNRLDRLTLKQEDDMERLHSAMGVRDVSLLSEVLSHTDTEEVCNPGFASVHIADPVQHSVNPFHILSLDDVEAEAVEVDFL